MGEQQVSPRSVRMSGNGVMDWDSDSCHTDLPSLADVSDYDSNSCSTTSTTITAGDEHYRQQSSLVTLSDPSARKRANSVQFLEQTAKQTSTRPSLPEVPAVDSVFCPSMLIDSITTFLSCTLTPNKDASIDSICCANELSKRQVKDSSNDQQREPTADSRNADQCIAEMRTKIENDIVHIIGDAEVFLHGCNQSLNCVEGNEEDMATTARQSPYDGGKFEDKKKPRNRNAYQRDMAAQRIQNLRRGSHSRVFSHASGYSAHHTDGFTSRGNGHGSESDNHEETTFPHHLRHSFPVVSIRSAEYISETRTARGELYQDDDVIRSDVLTRSSCGEYFPTSYLKSALGVDTSNQVDPITQVPSIEPVASLELFYDSDPGCYMKDNLSVPMLPRPVDMGGDDAKSVDVDGSTELSSQNEQRASILDGLNLQTFDTNDQRSVTYLINELVTRNFSLIWHPYVDQVGQGITTSHPKSMRVNAYLEMGQCLKSLLVQPKFMWRNTTVPEHINGKKRLQCVSFQNPIGIDLLNIIRIMAPNSVDRAIHPFAKLEQCFIICNSSDEEYLFEAATELERDRFVFSLKLLVARLASKIIVGDKDVFDEFFTPWGIIPRKKKSKKKYSRRRRRRLAALKSSVSADDDVGSRSPSRKKEPRRTRSELSSSNFVSAVVEQEGQRTDELWGSS